MEDRNFKIVSILLAVCLAVCFNLMARNIRKPEFTFIPYASDFYENDGSVNMYIVGITDSISPLILKNKYDTMYAVIAPENASLYNLNYNSMLDNDNCCIVLPKNKMPKRDLIDFAGLEELCNYEIYNGAVVESDYIYSDRYKKIEFTEFSGRYIEVLIQGLFFNVLTYYGLGFVEYVEDHVDNSRVEPFCNQYAFYKVLIPIK